MSDHTGDLESRERSLRTLPERLPARERGERRGRGAESRPATRVVPDAGDTVLAELGADGAAKRILDLALAAAGLLVTLPLWILLSIAIKLEDGGPVFFRQERVGRGGERFTVLKFRSMVPDAGGGRLAQQDEPDEELITRVGAFMRSTALDELPQILNILRGEMSFVGPRPCPPVERCGETGRPVRVEELPGFEARQSVRPGLTGPAQLSVPRDATHGQKFRFDLFYVENRSLAFDLRLILVSIWISLRGKWKEVGGRASDRST